jgi:hypothetical protein
MENKRNLRFIFYFLWIATLMLQSYYVELRGDEAYYWMYSKDLAWGYFDHPPVTAVLVKAGYLLFQNELGVRLFFILCSTATIWIMEKMIKPSNLKLYYAIVLSIGFMQIGMVFGGGMFAIPDFPLLFFTALFFYFYKQYLQNSSWQVVVILSVVICLMLLSKYHGVLIIGFTVLSNLSLLKRKSFWMIIGLSFVLFLPHLWWQFTNDFPSVNYHLYERSTSAYSSSYTTEYMLSQPFILGPFIGIILVYVGVVFKPEDLFERSLKFLIIGTYIFFFLMTFRGRVEGNWTIITVVPLLYIGYVHIARNRKLKKITFYSFFISLLMILAVRILLIGHLLPTSLELTKSFRAREWTKELKEKSGGKPIAFMNSYQKASLYEFYAGVPAFSLNNVWGRKNQFSIWDSEAEFQGKEIVLVANYNLPQYDSIYFYNEYFPFLFIDNFRSTSNVNIQSDLMESEKVKPSDTLRFSVRFNYRNGKIRDLDSNKDYPSRVGYSFFQFANTIDMRATDLVLKNDMIGNNQSYSLAIMAPAIPGQYDFYLSVGTGWLPFGINSEKIKVIVE